MKRIFPFLFALLITAIQASATDYYWVGGQGAWSDINHWATTSGGSITQSIVPGPNDDVHFDANSGLTDGAIVTFPSTGDAYCRNMSWDGVTVNASFRNNGSFSLHISGDVVLANSVKYGMGDFYFEGSGNNTFTLNGAQRVGTNWFHTAIIDKPGGSLTITDSIVANFACWINFMAGTLDMSGNTSTLRGFESDNDNVRDLDISNATISVVLSGAWDYRGNNKTITNTGSHISADIFYSDGLTFPDVAVTSISAADDINNTTITRLTFTDTTSLPGTVRIGQGNTITRLEFKGGGLIRFGGNTIDSLIVAAGKGLQMFDTNTINAYFQMNTPSCSGVGELFATTAAPAVMNFASSAVTDLDNVYITNMTASGDITLPIDVQGADGGNTTNWNFLVIPTGTTLYWVGGAGDWNDKNHWSATSGGAGGYCTPFLADDVVFDGNSGFSSGNNTVTTSANSWCHNMTWSSVSGSPVLNASSSYTMEVRGSIVLDNTVTMNASLVLKGSDSSTLTTNGSTLGTLNINVNKDTSGSLTLTDDLLNTATILRVSSGKLYLPGRTVHIRQFVSSAGVRTFDITNADITVDSSWALTGTGRTWIGAAAGSFITSHGDCIIDGLTYPNILLTSNSYSFDIANASIGTIRFSDTSPVSTAAIHTGNTIDTLDFKGAGSIGNNSNTINTLLLAPSHIYYFTGSIAINNRLEFLSTPCSGLGEMRGTSTGSAIQFGSTATVDMDNVYIQNIAATGSITPISVSGADAGGNSGFDITTSTGGDRYWVGGSGDWNDNTHWASTSGGAGGACVPTVSDNVFFDANSFPDADTVNIVSGNAYCHNMDWTGTANAPVFNKNAAFNMEVWGSLVMNPAVTMNALVIFEGSTDDTLTVNGSTLGDFDFNILKEGGSLRVEGDITNALTRIELHSGGLNLANETMDIEGISDLGTATATSLDISNSDITAGWNYSGSNQNLTATGSHLSIPGSHSITINGGAYHTVDVMPASSAYINDISNASFDTLLFSNASTTSAARIAGNNTISYLEFKGKGQVSGSNNLIDTLVFAPGKVYTFSNGTQTTINGAWYGSGTPCNLTEINSPSGATINMSSGNVEFDYVRVQNITAGINTPFTALEHSIDLGGNSNWAIAPYNGAAPIYGLGPDTSVTTADFPYTLNTDGFFGSPLSQYLWNDGSTSDHLDITDTGTYYVTVSFVDGCSVSDSIHIELDDPLPIVLEQFNAAARGCNAILNWSVGNAENFNAFGVERSTDGKHFNLIATIPFNEHAKDYTYTDETTGSGNYFYRLKLTDNSNTYNYSVVRSVQLDCGSFSNIRVYPNPATGDFHVRSSQVMTQITILTAEGKEVLQYDNRRSLTGDVLVRGNILPAGTYFIKVKMEDGSTELSKLVKQ